MSPDSRTSLVPHRDWLSGLTVPVNRAGHRWQDGIQAPGLRRLRTWVTTAVVVLSLLAGAHLAGVSLDIPASGWALVTFFMVVLLVGLNVLLTVSFRKMSNTIKTLESELNETRRELEQTGSRLSEVTTRDELTGCYNPDYFRELLGQHMAMCQRLDYRFCLVLIQIDQYADVVGRHGLQCANDLLKLFSRIVDGALREVDVTGRINAETFGLILADTDEAAAIDAINRINGLLSQLYLPEDTTILFTTSSGVTPYYGFETAEELVSNANDALSLAVSEGGNRIAGYACPRQADISGDSFLNQGIQ